MHGSTSGVWKQGMVRLMRHGHTKGPDTARLNLNHRPTPRSSRLNYTCERDGYSACRLSIYCGRRMLGLQAQIRRWDEACAWLNGVPVGPCSGACPALNPKSLDKSMPTRFSSALGGCRAGSHRGRATTDQHEHI